MGFHNFHRKFQKLNVLYASLPKQLDTRGLQQQQLIQDQQLDRGKIFIRVSQAKCASYPYPSSYAHGQVPNTANLLHARFTSSTISSIPGNYRHQATIHPHASNRSRRRIHQPSDASSPQRTYNKPCRLCQRRALFSRSS